MSDDFKEFIQENYQQGTLVINLSASYQLKVGPQGMKVVVQKINWPITYLNLMIYFIGNQGMQTLIKAGKQWPTLRELDLQKNNITCDGLQGIANAGWNQLRSLHLNKNGIKSRGFAYLVEADWPHLQQLDISHSQIGLQGARLFPKTNWPKLQHLNLNYSLITCQGVRQLSKCDFHELKSLQLSNNKLYAKGMFYLSTMKLPNLKHLSLNKNLIGRDDRSISQLGCYYLSKLQVESLKSLRLFGNDITLNGIRQILYSGKLGQNCFLQMIRNFFNFSQIQQDIIKCNVFSNQF